MSSRAEIERELERFIFEEVLEEAPSGGDPLSAGAVDSLGIEQLVEHVAREFGVRFSEAEMVRDNFDAVATLAALIETKQADAPR